MKKVIILGSKPYAKIPDGDIIYSANGATAGNKIKIGNFSNHINVAHVYALNKGLKKEKSKRLYNQKLKAIHESGFERLVLLTLPKNNSSIKNLKNYFTDTHRKGIEVVSFYNQRIIVRKIGMCGYPIINKYFFHQKPKYIINDGLRIVKALLSRKFGKGYIDVYSAYRPSTGILALLIAINENGPSSQYILSGIGIKNRNQFLINDEIHLNNIKTKNSSIEHSYADAILLRNLRERFNLQTTEKELSHILPRYRHRN